ncbi:MAG TPA: pitrilysin family protein [Anaerolineales bacterium]|nr:pitrilysin family protein [Anaerolineales bacterium]
MANQQSTISILQSLPGPDDITRVTLPNGITLLARANFSSPSVVISGYLHAGSLYEADEKLGLANFTAAALMHGTAHHAHQELFDVLETAGASLGFDGGVHTISVSGRALSEDLDLLLDLAAECLRHPTFPPEEIERLRAQILTGLALRDQDPDSVASLTFDKLIYEHHPYSRPNEGEPHAIQAITRDDLFAFHQQSYGPRGMVLTIDGGMQPERAIEKVAQAFGDWQNPHQPETATLPELRPLSESKRQHISIPGKSQTSLVLGVAGPARKTPGYLAASMGNNILGQFGMYGRIGEVVREQAGLAYYAYSNLSGGVGPGPWLVAAGVAPEDVDEAIELIQSEITRFVADGIAEEELADTKANYIGRLPLSLESNAGVASALLNIQRHDLPLDYYWTYAERINAVTTEEVVEVARQYLDVERMGVASAGPD